MSVANLNRSCCQHTASPCPVDEGMATKELSALFSNNAHLLSRVLGLINRLSCAVMVSELLTIR